MKANYHSHTARCQHAQGTDEDYVRAAIAGGFDALGFSDHAPWPYRSGYVSSIRMAMTDLPGYMASVRALRAKYAGQLPIYLGLEAEYFPRYEDHLRRMRDAGIQYYILGQHYRESDEDHPNVGPECVTDDGVRRYADAVAKALSTGLFCCLAHPDLYMRHRGEAGYNDACRQAAETISQAALEADVPLEYNLLGLKAELDGDSRNYPCRPFWEQLRGRGNRAILGVDAHKPEALADTALWEEGRRRLLALGYEIQETIQMKEDTHNE